MAPVLVGCDVGGTFTDAVVVSQQGRPLAQAKAPTTPQDRSEGVADAITAALERAGARPADVARVLHGTTTATNAVLEGDLARVALVTNDGFEDVLEIGRQARPSLYDLAISRPPALVARADRYGVPVRMAADGKEVTALDEGAVRALANELAKDVPDAVAVCLLHAHVDGQHEARVAALLREVLACPIVTSHEVNAEFREVERFTTTVLNAGLVPRMAAYLDRLVARLADMGIDAPVAVLDSAGALLSPDEAARLPVRTVLSGPAGGAAACRRLGHVLDRPDLVGVDMGGTSTDVTLLLDGKPTERWRASIGGHELQVPAADIDTVGAGGGSIAWVDEAGALRVGPQSAGADPGPACYGRGGRLPTVTDAHVVLSRIPADARLGGRVALDRDAARDAVASLGKPLGLDEVTAARAVLEVATAVALRGVRRLFARHACDPARLTLVAFGGAGPLFGAEWAEELGVAHVVVPRGAGVTSAAGLLAAPPRLERARTVLARSVGDDMRAFEPTFQALASEALEALDHPDARVTRLASVRYEGQSHELTVPCPGGGDELRKRFSEAHYKRFGYVLEDQALEVVTLRARAEAPPPLALPTTAPARTGREVRGRPLDLYVLGQQAVQRGHRIEAEELAPGDTLVGPALVVAEDATTLVPPAWRGLVHHDGHLLLEHMEGP